MFNLIFYYKYIYSMAISRGGAFHFQWVELLVLVKSENQSFSLLLSPVSIYMYKRLKLKMR